MNYYYDIDEAGFELQIYPEGENVRVDMGPDGVGGHIDVTRDQFKSIVEHMNSAQEFLERRIASRVARAFRARARPTCSGLR